MDYSPSKCILGFRLFPISFQENRIYCYPKVDNNSLEEKIDTKVERLSTSLNIIGKLLEKLIAYKLLLTTKEHNLHPYL